MMMSPARAAMLDAYLTAYPGWLSDEEALSLTDLPQSSVYMLIPVVLRDSGFIEKVPGQRVRLSNGNTQTPCRITDAGAVALRDWKDARGIHQQAEDDRLRRAEAEGEGEG